MTDEPARRRRWPRRLVLGVLLVVVVFHLAGGWYLAGVLHERALSGEARRASLAFDPDLTVQAVTDDAIVLHADGEAPAALDTPGTFGLRWEGGHGTVGEIASAEGPDVARSFAVLAGEPPVVGDPAELEPRIYETPAEAGLRAEEVTIEGDLGSFPAWFVPADGPTWSILVHGNSLSRTDVIRWLPALHDAGVPTLTPTYRNDAGAPEDPSGLLRYGATEWDDLEAAVRYALAQGSDGVTLFGTSMGGGIVEAFLRHSELAGSVRAVALDAPMLDFSTTVDDNASREPLVGPITVPPTLTWVAKRIADLRYHVGWDELDYLDDGGLGDVPTLIVHGDADTTVPIGTSRTAASRYPATVTLVACPGADHIECWNLDPEGTGARVASFLADPPPVPVP